jgi:hypothetical protein
MSGWNTLFDVTNLALNVSNFIQLSNQRDQLGSMQEQAMLETLRQRIIEIMRDEVFSSGQQLKVLHEFKEEAPQAVYVAASSMAWRLESAGITQEAFPEFRDKEYVEEVWTRLRDTVQDARDRLNPKERQDADDCVQLISQMPLLSRAIELQSMAEAREDTEAKWQQAEAKRKQNDKLAWVLMFVAFGLFLVTCIGSFAIGGIASSRQADFPVPVPCCGVVMIGLPLVAGVASSILRIKGKGKEWKALKAERTRLDSEIGEQRDTYQRIYETFGRRTSAEYEAMRSEREAEIRRFLSGAEQFALPPDLRAE